MFSFIKEMSKEDKDYYARRHRLYEYYGIPEAEFDSGTVKRQTHKEKQMERDWIEASLYIDKGREGEIPEDLKKRLLKYKEESNRK